MSGMMKTFRTGLVPRFVSASIMSLAVAAFAAGVGMPGIVQETRAQELGIAIGEKAPGGPLETLDGKEVDFGQYLGKTPVVVEFWATWCDNCKALEPRMRAAMARHKEITFVTVAVSVNQSLSRVQAWQRQFKLGGTILYDRKGVVSSAFDVPATSYVAVIDTSGKIVYTGVGGTQDIEAAIAKLSK